MNEFSANDFTPYLSSGTRVKVKSLDPYLNGKTGSLQGDRLSKDNLDILLKGKGPIRELLVDGSKEIIRIEESLLEKIN